MDHNWAWDVGPEYIFPFKIEVRQEHYVSCNSQMTSYLTLYLAEEIRGWRFQCSTRYDEDLYSGLVIPLL